MLYIDTQQRSTLPSSTFWLAYSHVNNNRSGKRPPPLQYLRHQQHQHRRRRQSTLRDHISHPACIISRIRLEFSHSPRRRRPVCPEQPLYRLDVAVNNHNLIHRYIGRIQSQSLSRCLFYRSRRVFSVSCHRQVCMHERI